MYLFVYLFFFLIQILFILGLGWNINVLDRLCEIEQQNSNVLSCAYSRSFFLTLYSFFIFLQPSSRQHLYKCCSICLSYSPVTLKQTANRIFLLRGDRNSYIRIIKFIQNSYVFISLHCFNGLNSLFVLC